ncbi:methyltransferase-like protein 17, mitochondrial [Bombina bombina]|uniref:methyltransferase-like protein 17, mitochondrial n=1 Tax=Bombina bombina TaxID=8345 RepID=UPI00235AC07C|nr:methyltransferase-like protein 17, mitochondrial [Bombina bombina]
MMLSLRLRFQQLRALSSVAPGISRLDSSSDFLTQVPHRKHPGILRLKLVHLPKEAQDAAQILLKECTIRQMQERVHSLENYLWSRKRPAEDKDLTAQAVKLEQEFKASLEYSTDLNNTKKLEENIKRRVLNTLRKNIYHWQPLRFTDELGLVYLAARFDGGFAAVIRSLQEIRKRLPEFSPKTLLDFGSGVGSVTWAAHSLWGDSLNEYMCIDSSASMNRLSELVMRGGSESGNLHISGVYFRQFMPLSPKVQYDLVVSAFSLNELDSFSEREKIICALWRKTGNFLVLVENGTREGHHLLMEARETILRGGDKEIWDPRPPHVFAPCPHQLPCPRLAEQFQVPCNFTQKYKPLDLSWNQPQRSEKFSFLIISRGCVGGVDSLWPRVIAPVLQRPRHVHCHTCSADGNIHHEVITARRHGRDLYRCARNSEWGDLLPVLPPETSGSEETENCNES